MTEMLEQALQTAKNKLANDGGKMLEKETEKEVIECVFSGLNWNPYLKDPDTGQFRRQYEVGKDLGRVRRADYAMFAERASKHPSLLLEAKQPGRNMHEAGEQVLRYVSFLGGGVSAAVATDGRDWRIYLPDKKGSEKDRLALEFSLEEDDIEYLVELLPPVLGRGAVADRTAITELEKHYQQTTAKRHFDKAWSELLGALPNLFIEKVTLRAGTEPRHHDAVAFVEEKLAEATKPVPSRNNGRRKNSKRKTRREPMPAKGTLYLPGKPNFQYDNRTHAIRQLVDWAHRIDQDSLNSVGRAYVKRERTERCKYPVGMYWVNVNMGDIEAGRFVQKLAKALGKDIEYSRQRN